MNMNFEFEPKITEDFLLSKYSEETYMSHYSELPIDKKLHISHLRTDHKPTVSFTRNSKGRLVYKDFAYNEHYGTFVNIAMIKYGCSYYQALIRIAEDFGIIKPHTETITYKPIQIITKKFVDTGPCKIQITAQKFTDKELNWWKSFGISLETLKRFHVYSCKHVFVNDALTVSSSDDNPIFGYYFGKVDGRELWKIYMPMRESKRFINNLDAKRLQGFKQLPEKGPILVITKSQKDLMCLSEFGIPAIAPNSEQLFVEDKTLDKLKSRFKKIIVLYDNDKTGLHRTWTIRKQHPELIYTYIPRSYHAKDISDFCNKNGKKETFNLIKKYLIYLKKIQ